MKALNGRTSGTLLNISASLIGQVVGVLFTLIGRLIFLHILGSEYLGLSGLFSNILTMLSLAELGVGPAISYSLYKPLKKNDTEKIKTLMSLYRKAYWIVGITILLLGLVFLPFYRLLIKETPGINNLDLIFYLFVINTSISYFFSYKKSIFTCDQKRYVVIIFRYSFFGLLQIIQACVLLATSNYILYLVVQICTTFAENLSISFYSNKKYPFLKEKNVSKLDKNEFLEIKKNVGAIMLHKVGGTVVNSTDNLLLSKIFGLVVVGLYSNYLVIISALRTIIQQLFVSVVASIGNLHVDNDNEKQHDVFNKLFYGNFWICSFTTICLLILFNPFITIWVGDKYLLENNVVIAIALSFFLENMRKTLIAFKEATGVFYSDRYRPVVEAILNLGISIILARLFGIAGVFYGTAVASIATSWYETMIVYREIFKIKMVDYYLRYSYYLIVTIVGYISTKYFCNFFDLGIGGFLVKIIVCIFIPNIIIILFTFMSPEFKYYFNLANKVIRTFKNHVK